MHQLTARWYKADIQNSSIGKPVDVVEIDEKYYFIVPSEMTNAEAVDNILKNFEDSLIDNTLLKITEAGDIYGLYPIIIRDRPDEEWTIVRVCICGSDATYGKNNTLHMPYCDKYEE